MKYNIYKLSLIGITILVIVGLVFLGISLSKKVPQQTIREEKIPEYEETDLPGKIVKQGEIPDLPDEEYDEEKHGNIIDPGLYSGDAPVSGGAIKVPEEPAQAPEESLITNLVINENILKPSIIEVNKGEAVALRVENQGPDYLFGISGLGISELIEKDKTMGFSFKAPDKETNLDYWIKDPLTEQIIAQGELIVN